MDIGNPRLARALLLVLLAASLTGGLQAWIGQVTIYAPAAEEGRLLVHRALVDNAPPPGMRWSDLGAETDSIRVVPVLLAELVSGWTGLGPNGAYRLIDSVCLFASLLALGLYLSRWFGDLTTLVGLLYYAAALPLTYVLHTFHPWDRLSLLLWIVLLDLVRADRLRLIAPTLVVALAVKWDVVLLPVYYAMAQATAGRRRRAIVAALALLGLSAATFALLGAWRPGGFDPGYGSPLGRIVPQVLRNLAFLRVTHLLYPPLLVFALPALLACLGWRSSDRFARAGLLFALLNLGLEFLLSNFQEVRAHMPMLVLMLPASLHGLERLLDARRVGGQAAAR